MFGVYGEVFVSDSSSHRKSRASRPALQPPRGEYHASNANATSRARSTIAAAVAVPRMRQAARWHDQGADSATRHGQVLPDQLGTGRSRLY